MLNCKKKQCYIIRQYKHQRGFTLIELIIVIVIIAILAAIAIPSYRRYTVKNAEDEAKAQMQQIQLELERWRASALSYKGFEPRKGVDNNGNPEFGYDDTDNTVIYVPLGSTASDYRYKITLVDGGGDTLASSPSTTIDITSGRAWKMLAEPSSSGVASNGFIFKVDSTGHQCRSKDRTVEITTNGCGTNSEAW